MTRSVVVKITRDPVTVTRAAIYCRISLDRTGGELGVRRQERDCRAVTERLGWPVAEVLVDNDASASTGARRPAYERLLDALDAGDVDAVVTYHPDRLTRRPIELEHLIDVLDRAGARVATVAAGDYDLSTASGRMTARIIGAVARAEAERIGERVARKKRELAEAGRPPGGGARPYGYEPDGVTVRPAEAEALRSAAAAVIAGATYTAAAEGLNSAGMHRDVGPWSGLALRQVLTGWRVAGVRTYRGQVVGPAAWEAILDPTTHRQLRDLAELRRRSTPARRDPYLLAGVGRCACGARLYRRTDRGRSVYYCAPRRGGCGAVQVEQGPVDRHVVDHVARELRDPAAVAAILARRGDAEGLEAVEVAVAEVEGRLVDLAAMHAAGDLEPGEWLALREPLRARLGDLRRERSTIVPAGVDVDVRELVGVWDHGDVVVRNSILRAVGVEVIVRPVGRGARVPVVDRVDVR